MTRRRWRWRITFPCSNEHPLISPPLPAPAQRCKLQQKTMRDCALKYCNIAINCKDMLGKAFLFCLLVVQVQYLLYKYTYKYNTVLLPPLRSIYLPQRRAHKTPDVHKERRGWSPPPSSEYCLLLLIIIIADHLAQCNAHIGLESIRATCFKSSLSLAGFRQVVEHEKWLRVLS